MSDATHDPGAAAAGERAVDSSGDAIRIRRAEVRVGTASWTDKTITVKGVFYPEGVSTPEARLRYYASRFPLVEADMGFYAIPDRATTERWVERTPDDFVFNVKAHALMTGHATDVARLPRLIRDELPTDAPARIYPKDLSPELRDEVWRLFANAMQPLAESKKLGAILLQFAPWIRPAKHTPSMLRRIRERFPDFPIAVEFRHPSWLEPRLRERLWALLRELELTYVIADTPQGTATSLPRVPAITTPNLGIVRLHGRRTELWGARDAQVTEKYRYLYDRGELEEWLDAILDLCEQTERLHVVFNNCYANYGTTNASEMLALLHKA